MTSAVPVLEHRFNDDLLISEHDQTLAKTEYPEIYHVLDHPELREQFLRYDDLANKAKLWVHRIGLLAVLLAVFALLGSAITPLLHQLHGVPVWVSTPLFWVEVGGIVGVVIAGGGMWIAGQKKAWLEARMMAEVLRLWHFQSFICRGREIESSCDKGSQAELAAYRSARARQFQAFIREWGGTLDSHLTEMIENPEAGYKLLHDEPTKSTHLTAPCLKRYSGLTSRCGSGTSPITHHTSYRNRPASLSGFLSGLRPFYRSGRRVGRPSVSSGRWCVR